MEHNLKDTIALLERTPATLNALLRDLPDAWTKCREGQDTWSPLEVIGHLIHADRTDWLPRARTILQHGDKQPFEPFDRQGHEREIKDRSLSELLDEFARVRSEKLGELRALQLGPKDLARPGRHPALGSVSLSELLATWAAHDLTHLHQISRILAYQYREAVGPMREYLGVMKCQGHSA